MFQSAGGVEEIKNFKNLQNIYDAFLNVLLNLWNSNNYWKPQMNEPKVP